MELIGKLWDSLSDAELPPPPAQLRELDSRAASFDQDRAQGVSWERLRAELEERGP